MPEKFDKAALFLRLGQPSTLIRHENAECFRKRSSNRTNLKTSAFRLRVDGKHFENGVSRKRWCLDNYVVFPDRLRLRVVPLSLSPSRVRDAKKNREKNGRVKTGSRAAIFFVSRTTDYAYHA